MNEEDNPDFGVGSACLANDKSVYQLIEVHKNDESRRALGERLPDLLYAAFSNKAGEA